MMISRKSLGLVVVLLAAANVAMPAICRAEDSPQGPGAPDVQTKEESDCIQRNLDAGLGREGAETACNQKPARIEKEANGGKFRFLDEVFRMGIGSQQQRQ